MAQEGKVEIWEGMVSKYTTNMWINMNKPCLKSK